MNTPQPLPLFPLHTVLFPSGQLPLRIFEARYQDMIRDCSRAEQGFGVCLIKSGQESGAAAAQVHKVGTLVEIVDWQQLEDGLLGVSVQGVKRFEVQNEWVQADQLKLAQVQWLPCGPAAEVPAGLAALQELASLLIAQWPERYQDQELQFDDCAWLAARLAELLPIGLLQRQQVLEVDSPEQRLHTLLPMITALQVLH